MPSIRVVPVAEAKQTRAVKEPGVRRQRMNEFDEYVTAIQEAGSDQAVIFEGIDEPGQKFVLTMRGALKRAGLDQAEVRKMRGRDEVRVWLRTPEEQEATESKPKRSPRARGGEPAEGDGTEKPVGKRGKAARQEKLRELVPA